MTGIIDSAKHAELIALQRAVFEATERLYAGPAGGGSAEPLREEVRRAAEAKEAALHASGLVAEYGYHEASQALKQAAKD